MLGIGSEPVRRDVTEREFDGVAGRGLFGQPLDAVDKRFNVDNAVRSGQCVDAVGLAGVTMDEN